MQSIVGLVKSTGNPAHEALAGVDHAAAKLAFFQIMKRWLVDDSDARVLLGSPSRSSFYLHKRGDGGALSSDTLERIGYVLGIFKALELLFADAEQADSWMRRSNAAFGGQSALERALSGRVVDLADVRRYLDAVRGGGR